MCCLYFLHDDVINEVLDESTMKEGNHDWNEVLQDCFIGKLVLQAIINALNEKLKTYTVLSANLLEGCKQHKPTKQFLDILGSFYNSESDCQKGMPFCWGEKEVTDARVLSKIMSLDDERYTDLLQKFKYGMVISLEERACLLELKKKTLDLLVQLDGEDS